MDFTKENHHAYASYWSIIYDYYDCFFSCIQFVFYVDKQ